MFFESYQINLCGCSFSPHCNCVSVWSKNNTVNACKTNVHQSMEAVACGCGWNKVTSRGHRKKTKATSSYHMDAMLFVTAVVHKLECKVLQGLLESVQLLTIVHFRKDPSRRH